MKKTASLCEVSTPKQWKTISTDMLKEKGYPVYGANGIIGYYSEYNHEKETLLITCRGATCGTLNISKPFSYINGNAMAIDNLISGIDIKYLYYYLLNRGLDDVISGSAQPQIVRQSLQKVIIEYPDLTNQKEVVEKLDSVERLIELRSQQLSKLDELVKSRFVEMFGDPVDNPLGWSTKQLQELVTDDCTISYGIVQTGEDQEEGVPVFRPVDIVNRVPVRSELKKTTEEISNKYKRTILKGREMLMTVRANIADTCIVGDEFAGCNVGRGIVPIRTREDEMVLEFLKYQIDSKHLNDAIKALAKGITLVQLNMEDLREVKLVVPPIEQQKLFIEFAKQIDKSKVAVQQSLEKLETLKKALMQQYFG